VGDRSLGREEENEKTRKEGEALAYKRFGVALGFY